MEQLLKTAEPILIKQDPVLGELIKSQTLNLRAPRKDYFTSLCRSIVGQQVSVAAATAIFGRLLAATGIKPAKVLQLSDEEIRAIGLSKQKVGYIRDLAAHFANNPDVYNHLGQRTDEQVITELTEIKGIGVWTAQMFLIFTLGRADVFAPDDLGLQNAMKKLYGWDKVPPKKELTAIAENWAPYRTIASLHLWQSLK
ncbi:MAG: DNA-3-methyladenine glycosylase [Candidatus Saccharibacteria bacterium]|nr:DNA-3-methyladenine glycosylase [Candidatus Saccharibacteria bacterium]